VCALEVPLPIAAEPLYDIICLGCHTQQLAPHDATLMVQECHYSRICHMLVGNSCVNTSGITPRLQRKVDCQARVIRLGDRLQTHKMEYRTDFRHTRWSTVTTTALPTSWMDMVNGMGRFWEANSHSAGQEILERFEVLRAVRHTSYPAYCSGANLTSQTFYYFPSQQKYFFKGYNFGIHQV
jgi:hypothetical protein